MDVPAEILEELKCNQCEMYLSQSPVYLEHSGEAVCGRCCSYKRPATRNKEYEAVAKLLRFPCKNRDLGCGDTIGFGEGAHEVTCSYRQNVCPVLGSSRCEWLGTRSQLLQHCQRQHPDHLLDNPCSLTHDITTSCLQNYLLQAFQLLFLLLTKVCVTSGRIYHSVRLLDSDDMAQEFSYKLHVRRGDAEIINRGDVAPGCCLTLQESTALGLNINSLLDVLGICCGVTCTVTVEQRGRQQRRHSEPLAIQEPRQEPRQEPVRRRQSESVAVQEPVRRRQSESVAVQAVDGRACRYQIQGCKYRDILVKCMKHELYFCPYRTKCYICHDSVPRGTLIKHYTSKHVTHKASSTWRATRGLGRYCLVTCAAGVAVCRYWLNASKFALGVYIPVHSERLCEFRCEIRVTQPKTGRSHLYKPEVTYKGQWDWRIDEKRDFPSWSYCEYDVSVNVFKVAAGSNTRVQR